MTHRTASAVASALLGVFATLATTMAAAVAGEGQPSPWQLNLQGAVTDVAKDIHWLHDTITVVITIITVFVLGLMLFVMLRFNERANPVPSKVTHNSTLEVVWTIVPVLILVGIAIPSFKLLFKQYTYPVPDVTVKATGNQWNWTHAYPDHLMGNGRPVEFVTTMLSDAEREALIKRGIPAPRLLAANNELVIPVNKNVHVLVTSSDVIHNWTVPSFGSKVDAVPGRTTATWFRATKEGIYYGQCSELCGKDHAFMPIAVRVVKESVFNEWIAAMKARDRKKAREIIEKVALEQAGAKVSDLPVIERVAEATR